MLFLNKKPSYSHNESAPGCWHLLFLTLDAGSRGHLVNEAISNTILSIHPARVPCAMYRSHDPTVSQHATGSKYVYTYVYIFI